MSFLAVNNASLRVGLARFLEGLWCLLPGRCVLCRQITSTEHPVCLFCVPHLPWLNLACLHCGLPMPDAELVCGACQQKTWPFEQVFVAFEYLAPVDAWLKRLKFQGGRRWGFLLGWLLLHGLRRRHHAWRVPDLLVPMPLHPQRHRRRGYNQSEEIGRIVARNLRCEWRPQGLRRAKATLAQSTLSRIERTRNVRDAFWAHPAMAGLRVVVIDDVMTTGATLDAASRALLRAGAVWVDVWVVARACKRL